MEAEARLGVLLIRDVGRRGDLPEDDVSSRSCLGVVGSRVLASRFPSSSQSSSTCWARVGVLLAKVGCDRKEPGTEGPSPLSTDMIREVKVGRSD